MTGTLSESDSKALLAGFGIPFLPEHLVGSPDDAVRVAAGFGGPVAAKLCGDAIAHKSERGLVRLGLLGAEAVADATGELLDAARPEDRATGVLIAPMATGLREFIAGISLDPVFGPTIVVGLGGVLAEALADVAVRLVPIRRRDAVDMLESLRCAALLAPFRGEPAVDLDAFTDLLLSLSAAAMSIEGLVAIDLNPLMIIDGRPVALDALVELSGERDPQ